MLKLTRRFPLLHWIQYVSLTTLSRRMKKSSHFPNF